MIEEGRGNLLTAEVDALVNTVNTVGVMGKGIALQFKRAYLQTLDAEGAPYRPEIRWMVDPNDFFKPMLYNSGDPRWFNAGKAARVAQFCN